MSSRCAMLAVLVLLLAGCTSATPVVTPTVPSQSVAAAPEAQDVAEPTLPVRCADVLSDAAASTFVQYDISLKRDETSLTGPSSIAALQTGLLSCTWGGIDRTDNSWDQMITISVLPNAAAEFNVGVWQVDDGAVVYPEGSKTSEYLCPSVAASNSQCRANLLVDGYWAQISVSSVGSDGGRTDQTAAQSMRDLVDIVTATISSAGPPRPKWIMPKGALAGAYCTKPEAPAATSVSYLPTVAAIRGGLVHCGDVTIVPGGAWAAPVLLSTLPSPSYEIPKLQAIDVKGADAAIWGCGASCYMVAAVAGSVVSTRSEVSDPAVFQPTIAAIVAAIVAAG